MTATRPPLEEIEAGKALLPCPFCGCDDVGTESTVTDGSVWCNGCRARITCKHYHPRLDIGQRDAIAAWNRRPTVSNWLEYTRELEDALREADAALHLAEGRIDLLLREFPETSLTSDHPVATRGVLDKVRRARTALQGLSK